MESEKISDYEEKFSCFIEPNLEMDSVIIHC